MNDVEIILFHSDGFRYLSIESQERNKGVPPPKKSYVNDYYNRTKMSLFTKNKYIFVDILSIN